MGFNRIPIAIHGHVNNNNEDTNGIYETVMAKTLLPPEKAHDPGCFFPTSGNIYSGWWLSHPYEVKVSWDDDIPNYGTYMEKNPNWDEYSQPTT